MSTATASKLAYIGKVPGPERLSDEWYTPTQYVELARRAMGRIDLDPFTCVEANARVRAKKIFTADDSALTQPWSKVGQVTVWMNPPYGRSTLAPAVEAFTRALDGGQVSQAVVLVNNVTETAWAQSLIEAADAVCFVRKRISFWCADGKAVSGNTRGQLFYYFGTRSDKFKVEFSAIGRVATFGG